MSGMHVLAVLFCGMIFLGVICWRATRRQKVSLQGPACHREHPWGCQPDCGCSPPRFGQIETLLQSSLWKQRMTSMRILTWQYEDSRGQVRGTLHYLVKGEAFDKNGTRQKWEGHCKIN